MITHLKIENFKSWRAADISLGSLTGLFGPNSSGKTSILQFLLMLKQTVESPDRKLVMHLGNERTWVELGSWKDLIFAHNPENKLHFQIDWNSPEPLTIQDPLSLNENISTSNLRFKATLQGDESGELKTQNFSYELDDFVFGMNKRDDAWELNKENFELKMTKGRKWDLPAPIKFYGFPEIINSYYQNAGFLSDLQLAFENLSSRIYYLGPLRDFPKRQYTWTGGSPGDMGFRGEKFVDAILAAKKEGSLISKGKGRKRVTLEERVAEWLKELGLINSFKVEKISGSESLYQVLVRKNSTSPEVTLADVGFGVSQILPVIALCYYAPEKSILLIEQPEIHLHPSVQAGLADVFMDTIKHRNVQIILESHSEYLLRRLQRRIAENNYSAERAKLYFCDIQQQQSELTPLSINSFGQIENWPDGFFADDFREITAMNKAILERQIENTNGGQRN
ncbi:MAG: hypothetical protein CMN32_14655 [Saprospirales bacterium]|nr:hypothetical protein [Saprospirales bacterium]